MSDWQDIIASNRTARQIDLTHELPPPTTLEQITKDPKPEGLRKEIGQALGLPEEDDEQIEPSSTNQKAKMRSEMFHQHQKQKRIAKIKSKLYHKIRNKRKEKVSGIPLDEDQQHEKEELMRIEERIGLRHSAKKLKKTVNKYAKDDGKKLISENEALRQRIKNPSRVNSEGKVVYESSSDDDEAFLTEQLKLELDEPEKEKGIMGMKFMKEAIKRQREKEQILAEDLLEELAGETSKFKFSGDPTKKRKIEKHETKNDDKQKELIQEAFEIDEMDEVAAEEWAKEQQEKAQKVPKSLSGWGSWFGSGIRAKPSLSVPQVFKTDKVMENDERDKRAAKYLVKKIPFPFKSARQFDAVHKIPIGKEWNSKRVYQKQIAPEILTRDGEIIQPISK